MQPTAVRSRPTHRSQGRPLRGTGTALATAVAAATVAAAALATPALAAAAARRGAPRLRMGAAIAVAGAMPMVLAIDASPLTQLNAELPSSAHSNPIGNL